MNDSTKIRTVFILGSLIFAVLIIFGVKEYNRSIIITSQEQFRSLPYLSWVPSGKLDNRGVTLYDTGRAFKGINIYTCRHLSEAYLMDMSGGVLHKWADKDRKDSFWVHAELCPNGNILVIAKEESLAMLDWDSGVLWINKMRFHHDIALGENGDIYSIARKGSFVILHGLPCPVLNEYIVILSQDGNVKRTISLFNVLKDAIPEGKITGIYRWVVANPKEVFAMLTRKSHGGFAFKEDTPFDIFHANTVEIIDRDIKGLCKKGDILICARELDLIAIVDVRKEKVIYKWGPGELQRPHQPSLLENGHILVFDNGPYRTYSRVAELDPIQGKIIWEYKTGHAQKFFSKTRGSAQRLPNGDTLIAESNKGRAIEITPGGDIVWEFYNPEVDYNTKSRAAVYRMMRITDIDGYPLVKNKIKEQ